MLTPVRVAAGKARTESFTVNVRGPQIVGSDEVVKRKPRELHSLNWDSKLTLEFAGSEPSVRSIRIDAADPNTPTVYLAGDSTVVDQDNEPWAAWGQMLPAFFGSGVAIANHAESGETIRSFESERRFEKIFSTLKRGDYLFFQFAHNDQKAGNGNVPIDVYSSLLRKYVRMTRDKGAVPVLVTSMNRRTFDGESHITDSLAPYPQTMREVATSEQVTLIDLNAMSKVLYESVGEPDSKSLFVYANANTYPGQKETLHDDTHFNSYGAYELARCVALAIRHSSLPLAAQLRQPAGDFDPKHPDDPKAVALPPAPFVDIEKPYER
jgi:lysophospholipase L1-like esterase